MAIDVEEEEPSAPTRRLTKIVVDGLFGMYRHEIPLHPEHITLLHGANGVGKTTLLKLVEAVFALRNSFDDPFADDSDSEARLLTFAETPFTLLDLLFDDGCVLRVEPFHESLQTNGERIWLGFRWDNGKDSEPVSAEIVAKVTDASGHDSQFPLKSSPEHMMQGNFLGRLLKKYLPYKRVLYISTERLWIEQIVRQRTANGERLSKQQKIPSTELYASLFLQKIRETFMQYNKMAEQLDNSYPLRLLEDDDVSAQKENDIAALRTALDDLKTRREELQELALFVSDREPTVFVPDNLDEGRRRALALYIKDNLEKIAVFDDLAKRIVLFRDLLQERFLNKTLILDRKVGFFFRTDGGTTLKPGQLSSGEQQQIVLFYRLLFEAGNGTLLMMDEPEMSLHIVWQERFLEDLRRIVAVSPVDVLLATHSPIIVGNRWEWTVALRGIVARTG